MNNIDNIGLVNALNAVVKELQQIKFALQAIAKSLPPLKQ